jgi:hypothetical protein
MENALASDSEDLGMSCISATDKIKIFLKPPLTICVKWGVQVLMALVQKILVFVLQVGKSKQSTWMG